MIHHAILYTTSSILQTAVLSEITSYITYTMQNTNNDNHRKNLDNSMYLK